MSDKQPHLDLSTLPIRKLYIDGEWTVPSGGSLIEVVSPDTEDVVARVAEASRDDVDRATLAARAAFDNGPWPRLTVAERIVYVRESVMISIRTLESTLPVTTPVRIRFWGMLEPPALRAISMISETAAIATANDPAGSSIGMV